MKIVGTLLLVLAAGLACKPKPPVPVLKRADGTVIEAPKPATEQDELVAAGLLEEARSAEAAGDSATASTKRDEIVANYPATAAAAEIYLQDANTAQAAKDTAGAITAFEKLLFYRPLHPAANEARASYAQLLMEVGRYQDAAAMSWALYENTQDPVAKVAVGLSLVDALMGIHRGREALEILVDIHGSPAATDEQKRDVEARALNVLEASLSFKDAESLWQAVSGKAAWTFLQPALAYKLAKVYYHVREFERASALFGQVATRFPSSGYAKPARDLMTRIESRFEVSPRTVGVLLPLSGKYKQYGERSLAAIKLVFGASNVRLVVRDSAGDPTLAASAVEALVLDEHVIAVIGPLFSREATAAAIKAEELSVPLISLSHREGLPDIGPYVFRTALTVEAQARALADLAFEQLRMSRFAILYPESSYGLEFAHAFWDAVDEQKGLIQGVESYAQDQTTFSAPVRRVVGRYWLWARDDYREKLEQIKARRLPSHRFQAEVEKMQKTLVPITDFDAIVIPDSGRNLGLIAPALAVEDVVTETDPKKLEKIVKASGRENITPVTLLGGSTWNTPATLEHCDRYCEGAIFVDAYYPDSPDPKVRDFVAAYKESTTMTPYLSEAQAYDTAALLVRVIDTVKPANRKAMREALLGVAGYEGVTGKMRFTQTGEIKKVLQVLTIQDGAIQKWRPASPAPAPKG